MCAVNFLGICEGANRITVQVPIGLAHEAKSIGMHDLNCSLNRLNPLFCPALGRIGNSISLGTQDKYHD